MIELILGGARSGKSALAERLAQASGLDGVYIATATPGDGEMAERIRHHRARRDSRWHTVEEPVALAQTLAREAAPQRVLLVDCLTLWLTNLLVSEDPSLFEREREALLQGVRELPGRLLLVSNEVGQGVVPANALARRFVDEAGWLHQALARCADRVLFVTAGIPQVLKGPPLTAAESQENPQ
jgi:adenosylcobinamide kinase/adenosylcobinamide-phosphate guanylyltransferase